MNFKMFPEFSLCLLLLALAPPSLAVDWQGTGNMNSTVMNTINSLITNNPISKPGDRQSIDTIAQNISNNLNSLWDPAWNVFIIRQKAGFDTVLYGYAYRDHWMWINGIAVTGDATRIWAYIIWKDYNCKNWGKLNNIVNNAANFTTAQNNAITTQSQRNLELVKTDIWTYAHNFATNVETALNRGGFSVVMSQDPVPDYSGYLCLADLSYSFVVYLTTISSRMYGSYFLFLTRK